MLVIHVHICDVSMSTGQLLVSFTSVFEEAAYSNFKDQFGQTLSLEPTLKKSTAVYYVQYSYSILLCSLEGEDSWNYLSYIT